jgi:putative SOS response-associated peptidase YedK
MCGRINVSDHKGVQALLDRLGISLNPAGFQPRYNIAPGAELAVVFQSGTSELAQMEWGVVPPWARPGKFDRPLINARAETIWDKPSFRGLIKSTRAVIPVTGFYEWKRAGSRKQPYYFSGRTGEALPIAGVYQVSKDGVMQCCIVTTAANGTMAPVHDRMPVVLAPESMAAWIGDSDRDRVDALMCPAPDDRLQAVAVSSYVNNARHEGPQCMAPDAGDLLQGEQEE